MPLLEILFYLFLITLPLGARVLVYQFTSGFHEYEAVTLYASDIFLALFLAAYFFKKGFNFKSPVTSYLLLVTFLLFAFVSIFFAPSTGLAVYNFARLVLLAGFAFAAARILADKRVFRRTLALIAVLAVIQSGIGFLQFKNQGALGLKWLGESPISVFDGGTSKIIVGGVRILRAYGTFPHPNILAAFLILGLIALYYFWLKRPSEWKIFSSLKNLFSDLVLGLGIFVASFGLMISFSRGGWLIAAAATLFTLLYSLFSRYFIQAVRFGILVLAIAGILFFNFSDLILPRATFSSSEPAVAYRLSYNDLGIYLIKNKPFGVGIGNQVLYSVKNNVYQKFGLDKVWQWQPIHNIYLLIASEIGALGLLAFLVFFVSLFLNPKSEARNPKQYLNLNIQNKKQLKIWDFKNWDLFRISNFEFRISLIMLLALLGFGFFDHFLWTIQHGRLMLWLVIAMVMGVKSAHSSTDRAHPSEG